MVADDLLFAGGFFGAGGSSAQPVAMDDEKEKQDCDSYSEPCGFVEDHGGEE